MNLDTFSGTSSLWLASAHDAVLPATILVDAMIFRVFSRLLDQRKSWYALNDSLCAKVPRKFNECQLFQLFPDDVRHINIADLQDSNGGPVLNQWFNKLDAKKSTEQVYVGSTFAVVAGNLALKNPSVSEFLRSEAFLSLKSAINKHEISDSNQDGPQHSGDSLHYFDEGPDDKGGETPLDQESKMAISKESPESPPNCSTPRRESPPKFESVFLNSSDDSVESDQSAESGLSISSLLNGSYSTSYKKRKIRRKVDAVMKSIETLCSEQGETLSDLVAQSCLYQRKTQTTFDGKDLICQIFSEVTRELGVRKTFDELIPEELWDQRVQIMSVPDWMLLLCKLESKISDDSWQMILNRTQLGKSGVSLATA